VSYRLRPVEELTPPEAEHVRRIYEDGFPPHQRAGFRSLTAGREPGELALALTGPGQPRGFAMLRPLGGTGWIFLRYFVVDATQRSQGLGGAMWEQLTGLLRESGYALLVFDVDDPAARAGGGPEEAHDSLRRIAFYERHGAARLPVTGYRTPDEDGAELTWTPMVLMAAGLAGGDPPTATAPGLRAVVDAVYRYRWHLAPDHPQVQATQLTGPA
jgi:GNAT superfamily N-acetyltransferase